VNEQTIALIPSMAALARLPVDGLRAMIAQLLGQHADASLYMRLARLFWLVGNAEFALEMQARALQMGTVYRVEGAIKPSIRLLALVGAGEPSNNAPLDYLIENSDIRLDLLYVIPGKPLPAFIPEHDVAIVALGESDANRPALTWMAELTMHWPRPLLNPAQHILNNSRDGVYHLLKDIPGLLIPPTRRISRRKHTNVFDGAITIRPMVSMGGRGLARIANPAQLAAYLDASDEEAFFESVYIDYRSPDGLYRKARIALIDREPCICHLAISENWIVHYGTAGMTDSAEKRDEEALFMSDFDRDFAQRHRTALRAIAEQLQLDYVVLDCAQTTDGRLLVFEADNRGWVHATDPAELFDYKQEPMRRVFSAFRTMLLARKP
jgi:hypothetical protein